MEKTSKNKRFESTIYNKKRSEITGTREKIIFFLGLTLLLFFFTYNYTAEAQFSVQLATVEILPGNEISPNPPNSFSFARTFVTSSGSINIFKTLDPSTNTDTLVITDTDPTRKFDVTFSLSDIISTIDPDTIIHFTNAAFVTLSASLTDIVDTTGYNNPPGAPNITAPFDCNWDPQNQSFPNMEDFCASSMTNFPEPSAVSTTLSNNVIVSDTTIDLTDASSFQSGPAKIDIEGDLISYTGKTINQLTGVTGIDSPHSSGVTVDQYFENSAPLTILSDSTISDIGTFSMGFGFQLNVDTSFNPSSYQGTLTFSLILS